MTLGPEREAQVLRYFHAEHWRVGTIARQLGIHPSTVQRVLAQAGVPKAARTRRPGLIDDYLPFLVDTLQRYPGLPASRLFAMARDRGYRGGPDHFRHLVAEYRPRRHAEAFLRLRTLPGEQAQVDWGHFGKFNVGRSTRALMAFVIVLSYSRRIFLRFFLDARMENFLRGHVAAFHAWQGVPRILLYDNLKSAVLERHGDAIRFHPTLLACCAHYHFEPRPVAVARGNEKGRVERAIRYIRDNFWPARSFRNLDDLNAQAQQWCDGSASDRPCPEDRQRSVRDVFAEEQPLLRPLPDNDFTTDEHLAVVAGKTPYVRFDRNDYSIPHDHVRRTLTVVATPTTVRVLDGAEVIAIHPRSYDQGQQIEDPQHLRALVDSKRAAKAHRGVDRLNQAAPNATELLTQAALRGDNLGSITAALLRLLDDYGASELQAAIFEALERGVPHPNAVRLALEQRRQQRGQQPPLPLRLPERVRDRDPQVTPHALATYDHLATREHHDEQP